MSFSTSSVSLGETTKKSHFDQLLLNTQAIASSTFTFMRPKSFRSSTVYYAKTTFTASAIVNKFFKAGTSATISGQLTIDGASRVRAVRSTAQTIAYDTETTIIFPTENYDNLGEYNTSTGIFTAIKAGYYAVSAAILFDNAVWSADDYTRLTLDNSGTSIRLERIVIDIVNTKNLGLHGSTQVYVSAGGTLKITVIHSRHEMGGGTGSADLINQSVFNYFCIHRLS